MDPPAAPLPSNGGNDPEQALSSSSICHLPWLDLSATSITHLSSDYILQVGGHAAVPASPLACSPDATMEIAAGGEVPEHSAPEHSPPDDQTSCTPFVCSDSVQHVGSLAAAFTSPHAFDTGNVNFAHAPSRCASAGAVNPACVFGNVQPTEAVVNRHVLLASPATATIFERSALLSNLQRGPAAASVNRALGLRPKTTAHGFEHLSALALASDKVHSSTTIVAELPDSGLLGHTDGTMLSGAPSSSSAGQALELPCGRICVTAPQASCRFFSKAISF